MGTHWISATITG